MEPTRLLLVVLTSVVLASGSPQLPTEWPESEVNLFTEKVQELKVKSEALCQELVRNGSYFEPEMVVGAPWRVYYIWTMELRNQCLDVRFKIATPLIIRRFYYDMNEYLEEQPAWGAASLILKMGTSQREMLLFDDQGPAGKFLAVLNFIRHGTVPLTKVRVPLMKFQMKLVKNGKYLILMDCETGVLSITGRADRRPDRAEIEAVARTLGPSFGEGSHACVQDQIDLKPLHL